MSGLLYKLKKYSCIESVNILDNGEDGKSHVTVVISKDRIVGNEARTISDMLQKQKEIEWTLQMIEKS